VLKHIIKTDQFKTPCERQIQHICLHQGAVDPFSGQHQPGMEQIAPNHLAPPAGRFGDTQGIAIAAAELQYPVTILQIPV